MYLVCLTICILICCLLRMGKGNKRVVIVVLGDIGRSPRMQYHAVSFAKAGFDVHIIGYGGSNAIAEVRENSSIHLIHMLPVPVFINGLPKMLSFLLKVIWQSLTLMFCLLFEWRPSFIFLQNPPSVPTMAICYAASVLRGCQLVIDWHNYGYTILALGLRPLHPLVTIYEQCERIFGRQSSANICVTDAMREDLSANWNIKAVTMHDRPPEIFRSITLEEKHELFHKLDIFREQNNHEGQETTTFTNKQLDGIVQYKTGRPALLVSSTSWTEPLLVGQTASLVGHFVSPGMQLKYDIDCSPSLISSQSLQCDPITAEVNIEDEDFSLLLKALDLYDQLDSKTTNTPSLVCVITGKGPQKEHYMNLIKLKMWKRVSVYTPWLEVEDYPCLLACADLGVCLHKSSSGYDLPMKVVDMFGCGLPVCAVHFLCLNELVQHDVNGLVFNSATELGDQLQMLLHSFPNDCKKLSVFRDNLRTFQRLRWDECWTRTVLPIFSNVK